MRDAGMRSPEINMMGEISFPNNNNAKTVHLKPLLQTLRQQRQRQSSLVLPLPPLTLWTIAMSLALYPVWVVLLEKYRDAFQTDWQEGVQSIEGNTGAFLQYGVQCLDIFSHWIVNICPRMAAALLLVHVAACLMYLAASILLHL